MKDEIITLPLRFKFVFGIVVCEVQEAPCDCSQCLFFNEAAADNSSACTRPKTYPWSLVVCSASLRSDGKDVSFVKVGEVAL